MAMGRNERLRVKSQTEKEGNVKGESETHKEGKVKNPALENRGRGTHGIKAAP
jgi:hypothetical protein